MLQLLRRLMLIQLATMPFMIRSTWGTLPSFVRSTCSKRGARRRIPANRWAAPNSREGYYSPLTIQWSSSTTTNQVGENSDTHYHSPVVPDLLIHWKGEFNEGYSAQFRHVEFCGALTAVLQRSPNDPALPIQFQNALSYDGIHDLTEVKLLAFNEAMQYVTLSPDVPAKGPRDGDLGGKDDTHPNYSVLSIDAAVQAANRCSLVHAVYKVVAVGDNHADLATVALSNGGFDDLIVGGANENDTWCFRARYYGETHQEKRPEGKDVRYGGRARSMKLERKALNELTPLLKKFGGKVNLDSPDCKIYIFDGLKGGKAILTRRLTRGPQTSVMDPNTRICVTNTPLCPTAAFSMCNIAGVMNGQTILDPFAGSCATLIASTMIAPNCTTVGIEIASDGYVDRNDIYQDFSTRGLKAPVTLIEGDSNVRAIRDKARQAIGNEPFDAIVTDPPYGIRESKSSSSIPPLSQLFQAMGEDRVDGTPLLRTGGKLVAFVPITDEEELDEMMPSKDLCRQAGLRIDAATEQPLNDKLSRWMVSYTSVQ